MIRPSQRHFAPENLDPRLRAGLVGHWIGGGSGRTWFDRSGCGRHGGLSGGPLWTLGQGNKRNALAFDGVDDFVDVPITQLPDSYSFAVWAKRMGTGDAGNRAMMVSGGVGNYLDWYGPAGFPAFSYYNTSSTQTFVTSSLAAAPIGAWAHYAGTYDTTTGAARLYVNGVLVGSGTGTGTPLAGVVRIGNGQSFGFHANGSIDDVRIYNRALSAAEIALLAQPSFLPVVPRRWFIGRLPTSITTDASAALSTWVAPSASAQLVRSPVAITMTDAAPAVTVEDDHVTFTVAVEDGP